MQCIQLLLKSGIVINHSNKFSENDLQYYLLHFELQSHWIFIFLFAAVEFLNRKLQQYIETSELDVPEELKPSLCFKHICREVIQKHLLHINSNLHLFNTIPNLRLPSIIK